MTELKDASIAKTAVKTKKTKIMVHTLNGLSFLGKRNGDRIKGLQVSTGDTLENEDFAKYLKTKQMGELVKASVGANSDVLERKLTRREKLDFKIVKSEFREADGMADNWLVNTVFDEFRSKK